MKILFLIPPFTQINTPYPSTTQLAGFLNNRGYQVLSHDLSLSVVLRIFSTSGLKRIFSFIESLNSNDPVVVRALTLKDKYLTTIEPVIEFLQGKNPTLAYKLIKDDFLPKGASFEQDYDEFSAFGSLGIFDKAKFTASLVLDDLTSLIRETITPHFGLSRYAEKLSVSPPFFDPIEKEVSRPLNLIEEMIVEETELIIRDFEPNVIGYTIPFPGNLLGALISAKYVKNNFPLVKIIFGGGYINTELRKMRDKRLFNYLDFLTYDDGELPLLNILINLETKQNTDWVRTLLMENGKLVYKDNAGEKIIEYNGLPAPSLNGLNPADYISMVEMLNPMHRLWSDGYWNKLAIAHGCYWNKCTFCDTTLDYIQRYSPARASLIVDWMEDMIKQTGRTGFHFIDEAAPPALLKELSIEIIHRKLNVSWWGNIRFEKAFTPDLCKLLSLSGCIAVSGGLEVADERLLKLIKKGVTLAQAAQVCNNFQNADVMVHAYLMYGFPSQTEQEIINSLEIVRQFLALGLFQSGFWHSFSLTAHSPIAADPGKYELSIKSSLNNPFANNDLEFSNLSKINYNKYSVGLNKSLYNYMHGIGLDWNLTKWFDFRIPVPGLPKNLIAEFLNQPIYRDEDTKSVLWIASKPLFDKTGSSTFEMTIHTPSSIGTWSVDHKLKKWFNSLYSETFIGSGHKLSFNQLKSTFPGGLPAFSEFCNSKVWEEIKGNIILIV